MLYYSMMLWKEIPREPLFGGLNINRFVQNGEGDLALRREPRDNQATLRAVHDQYGDLGYLNAGGKFRRRKPSEQAQVTTEIKSLSVDIVAPIDEEERYPIYPYVTDAQTIAEFLPHAIQEDTEHIVFEIFRGLRRIHDHDIVIGDRWTDNMLVRPHFTHGHLEPRFLQIDPDYDLLSDDGITDDPKALLAAKAFEVASSAYFVLHSAGEKVIPPLAQVLDPGKAWYNMALMKVFMQSRSVWHDNPQNDQTEWGGIQRETGVLIDLLDKSSVK